MDTTFRRVFDAHHDAVHRYCLRRLATHDANDAAAEVFAVTWRRITDVPEEPETLLWLYGVARNVVRNQERSNRRALRLKTRVASIAEPAPVQPEVVVVHNSEVAEVHGALAALRPADRELLRLKLWEELSHKDIGRVLGVSDRAVEGRYARAIKRVERHLTDATPAASRRALQEGGRG